MRLTPTKPKSLGYSFDSFLAPQAHCVAHGLGQLFGTTCSHPLGQVCRWYRTADLTRAPHSAPGALESCQRSSPMISVWWVLVAFVGGGCAGILVMALMRMRYCQELLMAN